MVVVDSVEVLVVIVVVVMVVVVVTVAVVVKIVEVPNIIKILQLLQMGWMLNVTMGTTAVESLNTAGNIFLGQTEAPLLIRPFIKDLTK